MVDEPRALRADLASKTSGSKPRCVVVFPNAPHCGQSGPGIPGSTSATMGCILTSTRGSARSFLHCYLVWGGAVVSCVVVKHRRGAQLAIVSHLRSLKCRSMPQTVGADFAWFCAGRSLSYTGTCRWSYLPDPTPKWQCSGGSDWSECLPRATPSGRRLALLTQPSSPGVHLCLPLGGVSWGEAAAMEDTSQALIACAPSRSRSCGANAIEVEGLRLLERSFSKPWPGARCRW